MVIVFEFVMSGRLVTSVPSVASLPFSCNKFNINTMEMSI